MKKILLALALFLGLGSNLYAAGASSPITGFSWDNVRKVVRFMTSDGNEVTVDQTPKQYVAGQTYNGVPLAVSVTSGTVGRTTFIPYRTSDGAWRLKASISSGGATGTTASYTIAGIVSGSIEQACSGYQGNISPYLAVANIAAGSNIVGAYYPSGASLIRVNCDVELASKPTWMD